MRNGLPALLLVLSFATPAFAQVTPIESVTLDQAVERALKANPTVGQAAQGILRAEALLQQARSATLPKAFASFTGVLNSSERRFDDVITSPLSQGTLSGNLAMPFLAATRWAERTQARDQVEVANLSAADVRTDIAVSTGQAYLAIIGFKQQVEVSLRALETSRSVFDYAHRRLEAGAGSRLNELRAGQEMASNEARLVITELAVRRGQEALGVLMAASGPVDAAEDPVFAIPATIEESGWMALRPDVRLFAAEERAADRVWRDSRKDWFPTGDALFEPQALVPASIFSSSKNWRTVALFTQPLWDSGERRALKRQREANLNVSRLALTGLQIQARSEVRVAQDNVRTTERALVFLRSAAQQAQEVVRITIFAFEAGATTNLDVIVAQRTALDADSEAAIGENAVKRAQLELLTAIGLFPR